MFRILHEISSLNPSGGGPMEALRQVTPHLAELGVQSTVACLDDPAAPWLEGFPCRVEALGRGWGGYGYRPGLVQRLRALAAEHDVVIVHGLWQYHGLLAWRALHGGPVPYLVQTHGMLDPWFKRRYPFKHLKKWCYWPWADYRLLRDAEAVLFTCERERQLARQSFWLYQAKERVIAFGTSAPSGDPQQQREQFLDRWPQLRGQAGELALLLRRGRGGGARGACCGRLLLLLLLLLLPKDVAQPLHQLRALDVRDRGARVERQGAAVPHDRAAAIVAAR